MQGETSRPGRIRRDESYGGHWTGGRGVCDRRGLVKARREQTRAMFVHRRVARVNPRIGIRRVRGAREHPVKDLSRTIANVRHLGCVARHEEPAGQQPQARDRRHEPGADGPSRLLQTNCTSHAMLCAMRLQEKSNCRRSWHAPG